MSGKKGRPLVHQHLRCNHQFDPVMVCSECTEVLDPRDVRTAAGPGARDPQHLPMDLVPPMRRGATAPPPVRRASGARSKTKSDAA
jgi:hypothetical protein